METDCANDLAARMVAICRSKGSWAPLTMEDIVDHILDLHQDVTDQDLAVYEVYNQARQEYRKACESRKTWNFWTFGIYGQFVPLPNEPMLGEVSCSAIQGLGMMAGGNRTTTGGAIFKLARDGFITGEINEMERTISPNSPITLTQRFFDRLVQLNMVGQPA